MADSGKVRWSQRQGSLYRHSVESAPADQLFIIFGIATEAVVLTVDEVA